jgi:uncharacterized radical SAM superfamily Fe-S cluster-containing enzyme
MQSPSKPLAHGEDGELTEYGQGRLVKRTQSLCPACLSRIDASVHERSGKIWMDKACVEHGRYSALLSSDVQHYYQFDARLEGVGSCCGPGQHCGDQTANHSCNMLIEITQRCNLECPTCFADSGPTRDEFMELEAFAELLDTLIAQGKGDTDLIQLSGGEPTLHPQVFEVIECAIARGIRSIYINTNGIKLASEAFAERLATYGDRVSVYLQLDGFKRRTLRLLRGREGLGETKRRALENCERFGIDTVPVMTLTAGVNDDELGEFLETAWRTRCVRKVMIQPAMYSGRYESPHLVERLGVADVARAISAQTGGLFSEEDFGPIPCADPNCFSMALALRSPDGLIPVSRHFPRYRRWGDADAREMIGRVADSFDSAGNLQEIVQWAMSSGALSMLDEAQVDALLDEIAGLEPAAEGQARGWGGLFAIGIKPFMDAYTYDQDRIDRCCVHIIGRDQKPVSFCEYDALNRAKGRL